MLRPHLFILALFLPSAILLPQGLAQDIGADSEREAVDELSQDLERILTLSTGAHMRLHAKQEAGRWLIQQGDSWRALPADFVVEAHTVKELLKEAKKRERQVAINTADGRAEIGFWLAETGLYNEALVHLDVSLRKDPDHEPTLAILSRGMIPMNLDRFVPKETPSADAPAEVWEAKLRELLDGFYRLSPATRELAWLEAAKTYGSPELAPALLTTASTVLMDHSSSRRQMAATAIQRLGLAQLAQDSPTAHAAVKTLVSRAALDGTDGVREAATRTLRDLGEPAMAVPFVKALGSSSSSVRANSAEALGVLGVPAAAPALVAALAATNAASATQRAPASHVFFGRQIAYIQDYDVEAFAGATAADPQINVLTEGAVLDVRVISVQSQMARTHERASLRGALQRLTGQDFRYSDKKWAEWLATHPAPE